MRILCNILVLLFVTTAAVGQQINPVPDYIFRNQMSVGRNAATDTAAYMSIGPRFGAVKGFMPPMVVDTNAVTGTKRNGLLIFSVQLNNFAYWDSTTSRFRKITAEAIVDSLLYSTRAWRQKGDDSLGALIGLRVRFTDTASMLTPYLRKVDTTAMLTPYVRTAGYGLTKGTQTLSVDSALMATRAWRQKGDDSLGALIGARVLFTDTATMLNPYVRGSGTIDRIPKWSPTTRTLSDGGIVDLATTERMRLTAAGRLLIGTTTEGTNTVDIAGTLRSTQGANFATSSGNVGIGTTSPAEKLEVYANSGSANYVQVTNTIGQSGLRLVAGQATTNRATRIDFMNAVASTTVPRWILINDFNQDGTNDFSIVDASIIRRFTILQGGNVGIGTTSPSEALHVVGRGRFTTIDSTASPINLLTSDVNGVIRKTSIAASGGVTGSGTINTIPLFSSSSSLTNSNITATSNAIIITDTVSTGNGATLVIKNNHGGGSFNYSGVILFANKDSVIGNTYLDGWGVQIPSRGMMVGTTSKHELHFETGDLTRAIIDTSGRLSLKFIDSTASAINILYADNNGVIKKARGPISIQTDDPMGGTSKPWKLGAVATVTPTLPNRTIMVEIDGTVYYIHAKTTND